MVRNFMLKLQNLPASKHNELDGCIVWNTHNTVLGSKRLAISLRLCKSACPKITSGQSNLP